METQVKSQTKIRDRQTIKVKKDQVKEDREDAEELESDGKNQIVTAEMVEPQTDSNNRSTETDWLARKPPPRTEFDEATSTKELLILWMKYVYYTQTQGTIRLITQVREKEMLLWKE
jgi:hypothetical protein